MTSPLASYLGNDLHPADLFKFVNTRPPFKPKKKLVGNNQHGNNWNGLTAAQRTAITSNGPILFETMQNIARADMDPVVKVDTIKQAIETYKADGGSTFTIEYVVGGAAVMQSTLDWVDSNIDELDRDTFIDKVTEVFGKTPALLADDMEFREFYYRQWDFVLAYTLSDPTESTLTTRSKILGFYHTCEVFKVDDGSGDTPETFRNIYFSKLLLPRFIYEVSNAVKKNKDNTPSPSEGDTKGPEKKYMYQPLLQAIKEVRKFQYDEGKKGKRGKVNNFVVTGENVEQVTQNMMPSTRDIIDKLLGRFFEFSIPDLLQMLTEWAAKSAADLGGGSERNYALRVGNKIINTADLCRVKKDEEVGPCFSPQYDFSANGSYFSGLYFGDLLVTKQQLLKYAPGEVAHIESLMIGLSKERKHKRLNRTESTTTTEHTSENETERESQTTERFSMEKEATKTINQDFSISAGVNVSANYGVVNINANLDTSYSYSQSQSQKDATKFSKDVTSRSLQRVKETVREVQTVTVINQTKEIATHTLKNETGDNVNGVYKWVDKFYLNSVVNKGKRMMLEFLIPEPASFYIYRKASKPKGNNAIENPDDPRVTGIGAAQLPSGTNPIGALTSFYDINDTNYMYWATKYEITDVALPPSEFTHVGKDFKLSMLGNVDGTLSGDNNNIIIPEGYDLEKAYINHCYVVPGGADSHIAIQFAHRTIIVPNTWTNTDWMWNQPAGGEADWNNLYTYDYDMHPKRLSGIIPINCKAWSAETSRTIVGVFNVECLCKLTAEGLNTWKKKVFAQIMDAYNRKRVAYEQWLSQQSAYDPIVIEGNNPGINRKIEREELKKRCIEMFSGQRFQSFDATLNGGDDPDPHFTNYPEILFQEAIKEGNIVKFFEQAFEWFDMAYIYYPYFYGRKHHWLTLKTYYDQSDPLFEQFLQAGYARVMVPVRPQFEYLILNYNLIANLLDAFGIPFNFDPKIFGQSTLSNSYVFGLQDEFYISIAQELMEQADKVNDYKLEDVDSAYIERVPTNLVYIEKNTPADPLHPYPDLPDNTGNMFIQSVLNKFHLQL